MNTLDNLYNYAEQIGCASDIKQYTDLLSILETELYFQNMLPEDLAVNLNTALLRTYEIQNIALKKSEFDTVVELSRRVAEIYIQLSQQASGDAKHDARVLAEQFSLKAYREERIQ